MTRLSDTQRETLARMVQTGGRLYRWRGGYWTTTAQKPDGPLSPDWWVAAGTWRALRTRGLIEQDGPWHTYRLTARGMEAVVDAAVQPS